MIDMLAKRFYCPVCDRTERCPETSLEVSCFGGYGYKKHDRILMTLVAR